MGLFGKPKKTETDEEEDTEWKDLKRIGRKLKMRLLGLDEESPDSGEIDLGYKTPGSESASSPPEETPEETIPNPEFQCKKCGLIFKESWNRCPKCRGEIVLIEPDDSESVEKSYPHGRKAGPGAMAPVKKIPRKSPGAAARPVRSVKRVKKVRTSSAGDGMGISDNKSGYNKEIGSEGKSRGAARPDETNLQFDNLFEYDPLLDGTDDEDGWDYPVQKGSWKEVDPQVEEIPRSHTPPPGIKKMLDELIRTDFSPGKGKMDQVCPECGFVSPDGDWEFCMKCGYRLRKKPERT